MKLCQNKKENLCVCVEEMKRDLVEWTSTILLENIPSDLTNIWYHFF
jgi:hypothetical protein